MSEQLVEFEPCAEKMIVVDERVADARRCERRRQLRFPDTFGDPCAARPASEMFFDVIREPDNLLVTVLRGNRDEDRLVVATPDHFNLTTLDHRAEPLEILGMRAFK